MAFIMKTYMVAVGTFGQSRFFAKNKHRAKMRAFRSIQGANDAITFKEFLRLCLPVERIGDPDGFGEPCIVDGRPAHWIGHAGGNSVYFCRPDSDVVSICHEIDCERKC